MLVEGLVILGSNNLELRETVPGHSNEIVVLVVVSNVESESVNRSVVGISQNIKDIPAICVI